MSPTLTIDGIDVLVEGQGRDTVVMIHGWPDTYRLWDAQVEALRQEWRCVRFTLPGFEVSGPRRPVSLDEMMDILLHIVDAVSPQQPVTLMLHDWGCFFGYQFALRHPQRVARIVGVDIGDVNSPDFLRSLSPLAVLMILLYQGWLILAWRLGGGVGDRMTRAMARALRAPAAPEQIGSTMNYPYDIRWMRSHGGYGAALPFDPPCPMLYIYGTRKPFMFHERRWVEALATRPGSAVVAIDADHWVMRSNPAAFNAALRRWLGAA